MTRRTRLLVLLIFVTIIETLLFAFIPGGWSSYIYVLINKGFYANLCSPSGMYDQPWNTSLLSNLTTINQTLKNKDEISDASDAYNANVEYTVNHSVQTSVIKKFIASATSNTCREQQEQLHFLYTISVALLELLTVSWGPLVYRFGVIGPKVFSMLLFISGCLMLGLSNPDIPLLVVPGMVLVGVGGLGIVVINMKVSSILPFGTGLYVAVLNGACDSSVITFRIVKLLNEYGVHDLYPFIGIIVLHIILSGSSLILHKILDHPKISSTNEEVPMMETGSKKPNNEVDTAIQLTKKLHKKRTPTDGEPTVALKDSLCSFVTFSMMVWVSVLMLYFFLYLGTINSRLQNTIPNKVSHLTNVMAYIMFGGMVTALVPGSVAEWQMKMFKGRTNSLERSLLPNIASLVITTILAVLLNVLAFIESETVFYVEFAVLTVFRSFLYSSNMAFIVSAFPITHTNIIFPLSLTVGGTLSMIQYAIFAWNNHTVDSRLHVKIFMTVLVALSLIHPIVTYLTAKGVLRRTAGSSTEKK